MVRKLRIEISIEQNSHYETIKLKTMLITTLKTLFNRDLNRLKSEIEQYSSEKAIWKVDKNIANSTGNLCLHLLGNLNTFIGAQLGQTAYIRQRELEFSLKDIPRKELIEQIENLLPIIDETLDKLTPQQLESNYPINVFKKEMTTSFFLIHLATHLNYHLGQINYHRRLLDE